jgi:pantoate--beta-alanine ligase
MKIISAPKEMKKVLRINNDDTGFVPTMGALHDGHINLIKKSLEENKKTIVSIFVNSTQFNDPKDLKNYPNKLEKDILLLSTLNVDYVFIPDHELIYNDNYAYRIIETQFSNKLCGEKREGHFEGVLTIVMKLLNIVAPTKAYFGEKDYQQYLLIKGMVEAFHMDVQIISFPTVREEDGLALSSRNLLLSPDERKKAPLFSELLKSQNTDEEIKTSLLQEGFEIDYIETLNGRRFGAVFLGKVRLIDNVKK